MSGAATDRILMLLMGTPSTHELGVRYVKLRHCLQNQGKASTGFCERVLSSF
jgi:hypothetical protein